MTARGAQQPSADDAAYGRRCPIADAQLTSSFWRGGGRVARHANIAARGKIIREQGHKGPVADGAAQRTLGRKQANGWCVADQSVHSRAPPSIQRGMRVPAPAERHAPASTRRVRRYNHNRGAARCRCRQTSDTESPGTPLSNHRAAGDDAGCTPRDRTADPCHTLVGRYMTSGMLSMSAAGRGGQAPPGNGLPFC